MEFPYGRAPLVILILAVATGLGIAASSLTAAQGRKPDLIMAIFAKDHATAYRPIIEQFEKERGVKIQLQVVEQRALDSRLQSALQVGAEVPDVVELLDGSMGTFTQGPLEDVGLMDLTDLVKREKLDERLVKSRFAKWSSRGRIFAIPHDVHPVMLAYRRDIVEQLGIDVSKLTTWEEFCRVGREVVTKDLNGDGVIDRYMIDLDVAGSDHLRLLLLQAGEALLAPNGDVAYDTEGTAKVVEWYVRQHFGPGRIAFTAGWGQTLAQTMTDGLVLFYITPDWRSRNYQADIKAVDGKMGLMPLPAWSEGGRRTTTWGGTGLAIPKKCRNPELAWDLAMRLYFEPKDLGKRFKESNILPPLKEAWNEPELDEPRSFYGGQAIGRAYAELAPQVPEEQVNSFLRTANAKLSSAYVNASRYYQKNGENGFHEYVISELRRTADEVRLRMARNPFLKQQQGADGKTASAESDGGNRGDGGSEGSALPARAAIGGGK